MVRVETDPAIRVTTQPGEQTAEKFFSGEKPEPRIE
jgi:hypothetical protein